VAFSLQRAGRALRPGGRVRRPRVDRRAP